MRINLEVFLTEREIAKKTGNTNFLTWLDFQIEKYLMQEEIKVAKRNKLAEINFLLGDSSIPQDILLNAKNDIIGGLM